MTFDVPRIGKESIFALDRRPIRQEIPSANGQCITGACVWVKFRFVAVAKRTAGIEVTNGTIRVIEISFIRYGFKVQSRNQILGQNLGNANAVGLLVEIALKQRIIGTTHQVITECVAKC